MAGDDGDPVAPGRGLLVYQPTTVVLLGTWSVPFRLRPRFTIGAFTPMAGIVSQVGLGTCWAANQTGTTARPEGTATGDGLAASRAEGAEEACAITRPTAPAAAATRPAPSIAADSSRACAAHTAETRPATRGRPTTRGRPATRGRRATRGSDRRRDTHRLIVVARIRPQDGSVAATCDGTGAGKAWPARRRHPA